MRKLILVSLFIAVISNSVQGYLAPWSPHDPITGNPPPPGSSIWPKPLIFVNTSKTNSKPILVDTVNFEIEVIDANNTALSCPDLDWARSHYQQLIRNLRPNGTTEGELKKLSIILDVCSPKSLETAEEDYLIVVTEGLMGVTPPEVTISATDYVGAIRALETFYQMLWPSDDTYSHYYVYASVVEDRPRFPHRGIMLDTARHYLPEKLLLKVLTIMMYNKFNVFHWHIVDDQSFPYVSKKFPELSEKGKYHSKAVYTPDAVQRVIKAAKDRGIRVILEFDTPGHAGGFGKSHRELLTPCYGDGVTPGTPNYPEHTDYENIDPTNPKAYEFMREFFDEVINNVSADPYVHLGMDEVYEPCWNSSPAIRQFMDENGFENISQVQGHYTTRLVQIVKELGIKPIAWQDPLDSGVDLDRDVIVQVWKSWFWQTAWKDALARGHKVILSACWYINYIGYGNGVWWDYYNCDPVNGLDIPAEQQSQILGGEACIWSEFVDQTNLIQRLFPYASTVASVLWDSEREDIRDAQWRLDDFRCSLLRRGVPAKPLQIGHCGPLETQVNLKMLL